VSLVSGFRTGSELPTPARVVFDGHLRASTGFHASMEGHATWLTNYRTAMSVVDIASKAAGTVARWWIPVTIGTIALAAYVLGWGALMVPCTMLLVGAVVSLHRANRDLQEQMKAHKLVETDLRFQAFHDPLTGLANRALFTDRLEHALARRRRTGEEVGLLLIDLDDFKAVNDSRGHDAGDELLEEVSRRLVRCIRATDTAARFGGDEFLILVEQWHRPDELERMARRVLDEFVAAIPLGGRHVAITASIGVAEAVGTTDTSPDLLRRADEAMYAAKAGGKARAVLLAGGSLDAFSPG
jgi:diguanylate cyclase